MIEPSCLATFSLLCARDEFLKDHNLVIYSEHHDFSTLFCIFRWRLRSRRNAHEAAKDAFISNVQLIYHTGASSRTQAITQQEVLEEKYSVHKEHKITELVRESPVGGHDREHHDSKHRHKRNNRVHETSTV